MQEVDLGKLINPKKFLPVYFERRSRAVDELFPYSIEIHPTAVCNYNCIHCSYAKRNKKRLFLTSDVMSRIIKELAEIKPAGVYFSGGGEPTTLPNWDSYIAHLIEAEIQVALITNGSLIQKKHLPLIRQLNYIAISIYSTDRRVYKEITGGERFAWSFELPNLIKAADSDVVVGARCVINHLNYNEVVRIYKAAMNAGYDYVIFIPEIDYEKRGLRLEAQHIQSLKDQIKAERQDIDERKTNLLKLEARDFSYYPQDMGFARELDCQAIALRTNVFINYDGGVWLCQPDIGQEEYKIGDIRHQSFREIWNSPRHKEVIRILQERWRSGNCTNCRAIAFNRAVKEYGTEYDKKDLREFEGDPFL